MPRQRGRQTATQDPRGPALARAGQTYRQLFGTELPEAARAAYVFEAGDQYVVDVAAMFAELFERNE